MKSPLSPQQGRELLHHTVPGRQKQAQEYLRGRVPGVMQHYAPDARPDTDAGWVESDETVRRLVQWREESPT